MRQSCEHLLHRAGDFSSHNVIHLRRMRPFVRVGSSGTPTQTHEKSFNQRFNISLFRARFFSGSFPPVGSPTGATCTILRDMAPFWGVSRRTRTRKAPFPHQSIMLRPGRKAAYHILCRDAPIPVILQTILLMMPHGWFRGLKTPVWLVLELFPHHRKQRQTSLLSLAFPDVFFPRRR